MLGPYARQLGFGLGLGLGLGVHVRAAGLAQRGQRDVIFY
jgi:hypothetical protein